jgi:predicted nucleotidyltransferase
VEPYELSQPNWRRWQLTQKGKRLAAATAGRPIHRQAADRLLRQLLDRVEQVREDEELLYYVARLAVFGSYLSDQERLADLDVAAVLEQRPSDEAWIDRVYRRIDLSDRSFPNLTVRLTWPRTEVLRILRGGSRALGIQDLRDLDAELEGQPHVVLYAPRAGALGAPGGERVGDRFRPRICPSDVATVALKVFLTNPLAPQPPSPSSLRGRQGYDRLKPSGILTNH